MSNARSLITGFLGSARKFPDRPAVQIQHETYSYRELETLALRIAATLQAEQASRRESLTGVFGHRSFAAFAGILGSLLRGDGYVPLNPAFPPERTLQMIRRARLERIVVERASLKQFAPILEQLREPLCVVVPDSNQLEATNDSCSHHRIVFEKDLASERSYQRVTARPDSLAYLLFTSGSTGQPKGVMVAQSNVTHFVDYMVDRYDVTEADRFSQAFDLTFDLSAFDMFVAWEKGGCVCCPTQGEKLLPGNYLRSQNVTIWFSVPSTAIMMKKLGMLQPGAYPGIRYSLFCGEALPIDVAESFLSAAFNSKLENLYGPTELTIACTLYRYDPRHTSSEAELGIVPIGAPFPSMTELIVNDELNPVEPGEPGELLMTGPQLSAGYWEDADRTAAAFVVPPGETKTYYRTGDRVKRNQSGGPLLYLGRADNQIKVQGYRVELGEIEALIRKTSSTDEAVAIGYPMGVNGAEGIIAFKGESELGDKETQAALKDRLPAYMLPRDLITIANFPLNASGKIDRQALLEMYISRQEGHALV